MTLVTYDAPIAAPRVRVPPVKYLGYIAPVVAIIAIWEILYLIAGEPAIASPSQTVTAISHDLSGWWSSIWYTVQGLLISIGLSIVGGMVLGVMIGLSAFWSAVWVPMLNVFMSVPKIVFYPLFLLAFGVTMKGHIAFAVLHGLIPVVIITATAVRGMPRIYLDVSSSFGVSRWQRFRYVILPALAPSLADAARVGASTAFLGLIIAEMFAAYAGLGFHLMTYQNLNQTPKMFGIVIIIVVLGLVTTVCFTLLQRAVAPERYGRASTSEERR